MDEVSCFSCNYTLANVSPIFDNGIWTAVCPACAVVNKLTPTPDREDRFTVSGAIFVIQKAFKE